MNQKQVDKSHYHFSKYIHKRRWISIWHQLNEVLTLKPKNVLELGPGPGLFKLLANHFNLTVETVDLDPDLEPDYVASADKLPMEDDSYDCVCAFQMLEHLPYEQSLQAFNEMVRVAKKNIVISLPDAKRLWFFSMYIPMAGQLSFHIPRPRLHLKPHQFDGEHHWEINKEGYHLNKVVDDFTRNNIKLIRSYRVEEHLKHRFLVFEKHNIISSRQQNL